MEGGKLVGSSGGGSAGAFAGAALSKHICAVIIGAATRGLGTTACVALASAVGGWRGGKLGSKPGELLGESIYEILNE